MFKVAGRTALPNPVGSAEKRDDRLRRIDSSAIIGNEAVRRLTEDHLDALRIGGPYGKTQAGVGAFLLRSVCWLPSAGRM